MHKIKHTDVKTTHLYQSYTTDGIVGRDRSVGIATSYGLDGPGIESRAGAKFSAPVQNGLGLTQPPVQWVPGLSRGKGRPGREADPSPLLVP
jgi:hypothetical protein